MPQITMMIYSHRSKKINLRGTRPEIYKQQMIIINMANFSYWQCSIKTEPSGWQLLAPGHWFQNIIIEQRRLFHFQTWPSLTLPHFQHKERILAHACLLLSTKTALLLQPLDGLLSRLSNVLSMGKKTEVKGISVLAAVTNDRTEVLYIIPCFTDFCNFF